MATQWCSWKICKGVVASKSPQYPRTQGMDESFRQPKDDSHNVDLMHLHKIFRNQGRREGIILRGNKGYYEDQIDYCSSDPTFQAVHDGLVERPSWQRLSFAGLLKLWYRYTAKQRHNHAGYAFKKDGNPTSEYDDPLNTYARSRSHLIAQYQDERRRALQEVRWHRQHAEELLELIETDSGYGSDSQTDTNMGQVALPFVAFQEHTSDSMLDTNVQENGAGSQTTVDSGHVSDSADERPVAPEHQRRSVEVQVEIVVDPKRRERLAAGTQESAKPRPDVKSTKSTKKPQGRVSKHQRSLATKTQAGSKARSRPTRLEEEADLQGMCEQRRQMRRERAVSVDSERGRQAGRQGWRTEADMLRSES